MAPEQKYQKRKIIKEKAHHLKTAFERSEILKALSPKAPDKEASSSSHGRPVNDGVSLGLPSTLTPSSSADLSPPPINTWPQVEVPAAPWHSMGVFQWNMVQFSLDVDEAMGTVAIIKHEEEELPRERRPSWWKRSSDSGKSRTWWGGSRDGEVAKDMVEKLEKKETKGKQRADSEILFVGGTKVGWLEGGSLHFDDCIRTHRIEDYNFSASPGGGLLLQGVVRRGPEHRSVALQLTHALPDLRTFFAGRQSLRIHCIGLNVHGPLHVSAQSFSSKHPIPKFFCGTLFGTAQDVRCTVDNSDFQAHVIMTPLPTPIFDIQPAPFWQVTLKFGSFEIPVFVTPPPSLYPPHTNILVVLEDGIHAATIEKSVKDVTQPTRYVLRVHKPSGPVCLKMDLNIVNHCLQYLPWETYTAMVAEYCTQLRRTHEYLEDAITKCKLRTEDQLLCIDLMEWEADASTKVDLADILGATQDIKGLANWLLQLPRSRYTGNFPSQPVLIIAEAGAGKTWSAHQLLYVIAQKCEPRNKTVLTLPFLIPIQRLAPYLARYQPWEVGLEVLLQYLIEQHNVGDTDIPMWEKMLRQTLQLRAPLFIFDGVDEAPDVEPHVRHLVINTLVPHGFMLVVTSRPQVIRVPDYHEQFLVLSLRPLNEEQQIAMIRRQVELLAPGNKNYLEHLMAFSNIRREHDRLWMTKAFRDEDTRRQVESIKPFDQLCVESGSHNYNPKLRQLNVDGTLIQRRPANKVRSEYLTELNHEISHLLNEMEANSGLAPLTRDQDRSLGLKVAGKLRALHQKFSRCHVPAAPPLTALWTDIVARTDELYEVSEAMLPQMEQFLNSLLKDVGPGVYKVQMGPLKDPVRIHEKATDEYQGRFADGGLPEACVFDVVRARVICGTGDDLLRLLRKFQRNMSGQSVLSIPPAKWETVRVKNKCTPMDLDPTHFRNVLINGRFSWGTHCTITEVQLHHETVLQYNDVSHAHAHYEFFRSQLCERYQCDLDHMLEKILLFFDELRGNPVQLALLVLLFTQDRNGKEFPTNLYQLYHQALLQPIEEAMLLSLQRVAMANQRAKRRIFSLEDVYRVIDANERSLWRDPKEVPLLKVLQQGSQESETQFQFIHQSFQEALLARAILIHKAEKFWQRGFLDRMKDPYYEQTFHILGSELKAEDVPDLATNTRLKIRSAQVVKVMGHCHNAFSHVKELSVEDSVPDFTILLSDLNLEVLKLTGNDMGDKGALELANALEMNSKLRSLDIYDNNVGDEGALSLAKALKLNSSLKAFGLRKNKFSDEGALGLAKALEVNSSLTSLFISGNTIGDRGALGLAKALEVNTSLQILSASWNAIGDEGALGFAKALEVNQRLTVLAIAENNISDEGVFVLTKALEMNSNLTSLEIGDSNEILEGLLRRNKTIQAETTDTR